MSKKKGPKSELVDKPPKPNALVIRGSADWREWVKRAAREDRVSVAVFLDRAAAAYAKMIGFKETPPDR